MARRRPELSHQEERARYALTIAMRLLGVGDGALADRLTEQTGENWSRQKVEQRRLGDTRIRMGDVDLLAEGLGINPLVFSLTPQEVTRYIADNHADLLERSMRCFAA